ncbi:hypothetical protein ACFWNG_04020 [Streptomyces sp. NPDC058391]|uniref:hypothetical protein n=1 Tax=Streptomyces sp. NPDC058391 TaxID=3346476 RepID=UPI003668D713
MSILTDTTDTRQANPGQAVHSIDQILDLPLPQLLAEADAEVVDAPFTDPTFYGCMAIRGDGGLRLYMPTGRSTFEHDFTARILIAQALGFEAPKSTLFDVAVYPVRENGGQA